MPKRARSYRAAQLERLKDPTYAAEYINAAMEAGDDAAVLLALRNVVEARTVNSVATHAGLSRESIYRMLSQTGNPCYSSLLGIFGALGLQFKIQAISERSAEDEMAYSAHPLVWEVNDCPRPYFSQKLEHFACTFRRLGTALGKQDSSAGAASSAPQLMELAA
jgi:probable addiction module antidote protein